MISTDLSPLFLITLILFTSLCLFAAIWYAFILNRRLQRMRQNFLKRIPEEKSSNDKLFQIHKTSCCAYRKFWVELTEWREDRKIYADKLLNVAKRSSSSLPSHDLSEILKSCLMPYDTCVPKFHKSVEVWEIIRDLKELFAERIYTTNITLRIKCLKTASFSGDPLFIKFILMNLIGRAVYCVPQDGKVVVSVLHHEKTLEIHVRYNGYPLSERIEEMFQRAFDLFLTEEDFQQICRENGILYKTFQTRRGNTMTSLTIPKTQHIEENPESNVVRLFKSP